MIHLIAEIEVPAGRRDEFLKILKANVPNVLKEPGCLGYEPAVDIQSPSPLQGPVRPDVVTVIEKWKSLEDIAAHNKMPHMLDYFAKTKDLEKKVKLTIMETA